MKTSDMKDAALNWAAARCAGAVGAEDRLPWYCPTTDWAQGGAIIEQEGIAVWPDAEEGGWFASSDGGRGEDYKGTTPLIAAMRCYVASKLGDNIDIPKELT